MMDTVIIRTLLDQVFDHMFRRLVPGQNQFNVCQFWEQNISVFPSMLAVLLARTAIPITFDEYD